jgi:hypothetical protein
VVAVVAWIASAIIADVVAASGIVSAFVIFVALLANVVIGA